MGPASTLPVSRGVIGGRGPKEHGPGTPSPAAVHGGFRRKEKALRRVAQAAVIAVTGKPRFLINDGQDRPDDDVSIRGDGNRNHRLEVGGVLHGVRLPEAEVPIVLDRHGDEAGDRISELLGKLGLLVASVRRPRRHQPVTASVGDGAPIPFAHEPE